MKWLFLGAVVSAAVLWLGYSIADIPCQDGVWDDVRGTCVPR